MYNDWIEESIHSLRLCQQGIDSNKRDTIEGQEAFLKENMPVKQYSYLFLWEIPELVNKTQDHIGISAFIDKSLLKYGEVLFQKKIRKEGKDNYFGLLQFDFDYSTIIDFLHTYPYSIFVLENKITKNLFEQVINIVLTHKNYEDIVTGNIMEKNRIQILSYYESASPFRHIYNKGNLKGTLEVQIFEIIH